MQQVEGPSTGMRQGPNEAVPPWLARQQPDLPDLFGASSSDDDQAPEQAPKSAGGTLDAANSDQTHTGADSLQAPKKGTSTTAAANSLTQTAVPAASSGLGTSTQQPELPASPLGAQREGEADRFDREPGLWIFVNLLFFCSTNLIERAIVEGSQREANVERINRNRRNSDEEGNML